MKHSGSPAARRLAQLVMPKFTRGALRLVDGGDWQARKDLENAQTGASSIVRDASQQTAAAQVARMTAPPPVAPPLGATAPAAPPIGTPSPAGSTSPASPAPVATDWQSRQNLANAQTGASSIMDTQSRRDARAQVNSLMTPARLPGVLPPPGGLRMADGGMFDGLKRAIGMGPPETISQKFARQDAARAPASAPSAPASAPAVSNYVRNPALETRMKAAGLRDGGELQTGQGGDVPGSGKGDKIPALYEPEEFVVSNAMLDAVPSLRGQLHALRAKVLAAQGRTQQEADAKAVRGGILRKVDGGYIDDPAKKNAFGDAAAVQQDPTLSRVPTGASAVEQIPTSGYRKAPAADGSQNNPFNTEVGRTVMNTAAALPGLGGVGQVASTGGRISSAFNAASRAINAGSGVVAAGLVSAGAAGPANGTPAPAVDAGAKVPPGGGAGRGSPLDPNRTDADASDPRYGPSRDFSNELNKVPNGLPADMRSGVVIKTVDPKSGRVTYSGKDVGLNGDGQVQMVDGMGRNSKMLGKPTGNYVQGLDANGRPNSFAAPGMDGAIQIGVRPTQAEPAPADDARRVVAPSVGGSGFYLSASAPSGGRGSISARNMGAADALAARNDGSQEARAAMAKQQYDREVADAQSINAAGAANAQRVEQAMQRAKQLRNLEVSASSITNQGTRNRPSAAQTAYQTALAHDVAANYGDNPGAINNAKELGDTQRTGMTEAGATLRARLLQQGAAARTQIDQARLGLDTTAAGFQTRAAQRIEALHNAYETAKPQDRAAIAEQIRVLSGKDKPAQWKATALQGGVDAAGNKTEGVLAVTNEQTGEIKRLDPVKAAPYQDGQVLRGRDGKSYVVKNGQPVLQ